MGGKGTKHSAAVLELTFMEATTLGDVKGKKNISTHCNTDKWRLQRWCVKSLDNYEIEELTSTLIVSTIKGLIMHKLGCFSHLFFILLGALLKHSYFLKDGFLKKRLKIQKNKEENWFKISNHKSFFSFISFWFLL